MSDVQYKAYKLDELEHQEQRNTNGFLLTTLTTESPPQTDHKTSHYLPFPISR